MPKHAKRPVPGFDPIAAAAATALHNLTDVPSTARPNDPIPIAPAASLSAGDFRPVENGLRRPGGLDEGWRAPDAADAVRVRRRVRFDQGNDKANNQTGYVGR
jgi:hypothetical protein